MAGKERFARVLRTHEPEFYLLTVIEGIAQPVLILVAQIAILVTLSFIKGQVEIGRYFLLSIHQQVAQGGQGVGFCLGTDNEKAVEAQDVSAFK